MTEPYWQSDDGRIVIYHGDSRIIAPEVVSEFAPDHVITDPPYNPKAHAGARTGNRRGEHETNRRLEIDFEHVTPDVLRAFFATVQPRRWFVATMAYQHIVAMEEEPPPGMEFIRFGIWRKPDATPQFTGDRPGMGWEGVCIMHRLGEHGKPTAKRWNRGGHHAFWEVGLDTKSQPKSYKPRASVAAEDERPNHPNRKPIGLMRSFLLDFTAPDDLVLDPFMGEGTTLRAALDTGRRAIGIELEEKWCARAVERLRQGALL